MRKPWADEPFPLLSTPTKTNDISPDTHRVVTEMSLAHNVLIRGLNATYQQAPFIPPSLVPDFVVFIRAWIEAIHSHHSAEETYFFPRIAKYTGQADIMATNIRQHESFDKGLEDLKRYADEVATEPATYEGARVRGIIDSFAPDLVGHLRDEIGTLLALERFGAGELLEAYKELEKHAVDSVDMHVVLPMALGCNDGTFEGGKHRWPPFPFFIPYLADWVFGRRHRGAWRFCPCTMYSIPRELEFGPEEAAGSG